MNQNHLNYIDRINLGSYYTNNNLVSIVGNMIEKFIDNKTIIFDSSCGYGNFFNNDFTNIQIGNDLDPDAINIAKQRFSNIKFYNENALENINREKFGIKKNDKLCIIGNPPYNDTTSIIRAGIKRLSFEIDKDIKTRDLGMSFLLSYNKLKADYICVLHPLSYLIKKSNFNLLKNFTSNYKLIDNLLISSGVFENASKGIQFPILIGLYKRDNIGMDYNYILNYDFKIDNKKSFKLNDFDYIDNYISKYPSKFNNKINENSILFWTMRDINALKRNRTFINNFSYNAIIIDKNKLDYYVYVDVFKYFSYIIPYYLGNLNVFINNNEFLKNKDLFIINAISRNKFLQQYYNFNINKELLEVANEKIKNYFINLLKYHYVYR
ncbi:MAG: SAM-dependent methyltransferase [Candidatus Gracilibacteria bacterium]|nr:SAM-dependent methyltransferase [Candidatus Gracilibacteria bacterium]